MMNILIVFTLCILSLSIFAEKSAGSHGGDIVVCFESEVIAKTVRDYLKDGVNPFDEETLSKIKTTRLLDYWEYGVPKIHYKSFDEALEATLLNIKQARPYYEEIKDTIKSLNFIDYASLPILSDEGITPNTPKGCVMVQIAIQKENGTVLIDGTLMAMLSNHDKAGLYIHEGLYKQAFTMDPVRHTTSEYVRVINSDIAKGYQSLADIFKQFKYNYLELYNLGTIKQPNQPPILFYVAAMSRERSKRRHITPHTNNKPRNKLRDTHILLEDLVINNSIVIPAHSFITSREDNKRGFGYKVLFRASFKTDINGKSYSVAEGDKGRILFADADKKDIFKFKLIDIYYKTPKPIKHTHLKSNGFRIHNNLDKPETILLSSSVFGKNKTIKNSFATLDRDGEIIHINVVKVLIGGGHKKCHDAIVKDGQIASCTMSEGTIELNKKKLVFSRFHYKRFLFHLKRKSWAEKYYNVSTKINLAFKDGLLSKITFDKSPGVLLLNTTGTNSFEGFTRAGASCKTGVIRVIDGKFVCSEK